jgi:uncharacterized repeat protein (TIGR04052 family)
MRRTLLTPLPLLALACGAPDRDGDERAVPGADHRADAELSGVAHSRATLRFAARAGLQPVDCNSPFRLGDPPRLVSLRDLRLFVGAPEAQTADGVWHPLTVVEAPPWQGAGVAMLDFEDASGTCLGTPGTRTSVDVVGPPGPWADLRFEVGVPFDLNHADPTRATPPLDQASMFWAWQSGYKFLRLDLRLEDGAPWLLHLGSTGCASPTPVAPPGSPCARPNRPLIALGPVDPSADLVVLDLAALVGNLDLAANTPDSPPGCMSMATEPLDCALPFAALGLDFAHGACPSPPCAHPALSVERRP